LGGAGGSGIGGTGYSAYKSATPGRMNTGSGGGGGGWTSSTSTTKGGDGGPGIAIIRIPSSYISSATYTSNGLGITTTGSPNIVYSGNNIIYSFVNSGTIGFTILPQLTTTMELLAVGGGGQGGWGWGGGGGAGGLIALSGVPIQTNTPYTITIGAGGTGGSAPNSQGRNGSNTSVLGYTAYGGGGGGSWDGAALFPATGFLKVQIVLKDYQYHGVHLHKEILVVLADQIIQHLMKAGAAEVPVLQEILVHLEYIKVALDYFQQ